MREISRKYRGIPDLDLRTPDRIFKVVFVGDSGVGKTCFLHRQYSYYFRPRIAKQPQIAFRFCHNRFKPLFNATIGVDFTGITLPLDPNPCNIILPFSENDTSP